MIVYSKIDPPEAHLKYSIFNSKDIQFSFFNCQNQAFVKAGYFVHVTLRFYTVKFAPLICLEITNN